MTCFKCGAPATVPSPMKDHPEYALCEKCALVVDTNLIAAMFPKKKVQP